MARPKRSSKSVKFAETRIASLASIDPALDLGNGMTLAAYTAKKSAIDALNNNYNTELSKLDGLLDDIEAGENELDDLSSRMLAAVGVKYGKNSAEYEKAGGTKTSERKRPVRKPKTT